MIPDFDANGNLPPGIHEANWDELVARYGWTPHRRNLIQGLLDGLFALAAAGCQRVYVNGSFITTKETPGDFDACWDEQGVDLNTLDSIFFQLRFPRTAQKERFQGEFFPAAVPAALTPTQIVYLDFFQTDKRTGERKGIVAVDPRSVQ
jgi:hypothetical protein